MATNKILLTRENKLKEYSGNYIYHTALHYPLVKQ